jgi:hypothetical protein
MVVVRVEMATIKETKDKRDDEILFIYANKLPMKIKTTPYYKNYSLNSKTKLPPYKPYQKEQYEKMEYCDVNIKDEDEYDGDDYYEE